MDREIAERLAEISCRIEGCLDAMQYGYSNPHEINNGVSANCTFALGVHSALFVTNVFLHRWGVEFHQCEAAFQELMNEPPSSIVELSPVSITAELYSGRDGQPNAGGTTVRLPITSESAHGAAMRLLGKLRDWVWERLGQNPYSPDDQIAGDTCRFINDNLRAIDRGWGHLEWNDVEVQRLLARLRRERLKLISASAGKSSNGGSDNQNVTTTSPGITKLPKDTDTQEFIRLMLESSKTPRTERKSARKIFDKHFGTTLLNGGMDPEKVDKKYEAMRKAYYLAVRESKKQ